MPPCLYCCDCFSSQIKAFIRIDGGSCKRLKKYLNKVETKSMQEQAEIFIFFIYFIQRTVRCCLPSKPAPGPIRGGSLGSTLTCPYSQSISINIGQKFLVLFDHELRNVVNRNTVKASYSNMPNVVRNAKMWKKKKLRSGECSQTAFLTMH